MVLNIGSMILLIGGVMLALVVGTTLVAFEAHWILGLMIGLIWTSMISFYIFERLKQKEKNKD